MSDPWDDAKDVVKIALEGFDEWRKQMAKDHPVKPPEALEVTGLELMMYVEEMRRVYPPQEFISPEGIPFMESPWVLSAPYVEGREADVRKWREMTQEMWTHGTI